MEIHISPDSLEDVADNVTEFIADRQITANPTSSVHRFSLAAL
ncbi:MAG: hypothetical protein ACOZF0_14610 [Thermodesulfobacteriota bacterium]